MARAVAQTVTYTSADIEDTLREYRVSQGTSDEAFLRAWRAGVLDHGDFALSRRALLLAAFERARRAEQAVGR